MPGNPALRGIDPDVDGRGIIAVIGPSKTGKTTLIRFINWLAEPTAGQILWGGIELARLPKARLRETQHTISVVFQEYNLVDATERPR